MFRLIDERVAKDLLEFGVDFQLHTHRHSIGSENLDEIKRELDDNVAAMSFCLPAQLRHFCYLSGYYTTPHRDYLAGRGILSATTCDAGLCDDKSNLMTLPRFIDGENISDIEFELYRFAQLMRNFKRLFSN